MGAFTEWREGYRKVEKLIELADSGKGSYEDADEARADALQELFDLVDGNEALLDASEDMHEACQSILDNWEAGNLADAANQCANAIDGLSLCSNVKGEPCESSLQKSAG